MTGDEQLKNLFKGLIINVDKTQVEIQRYARARTARVLYPYSIMTMDIQRDRVTIIVNDNGIITDVYMG